MNGFKDSRCIATTEKKLVEIELMANKRLFDDAMVIFVFILGQRENYYRCIAPKIVRRYSRILAIPCILILYEQF